MNTFNFILESMIESYKFYKAVYELMALSDRELNDLGITRGEIVSTVYLAQLSNK